MLWFGVEPPDYTKLHHETLYVVLKACFWTFPLYVVANSELLDGGQAYTKTQDIVLDNFGKGVVN
jgi:hypothetical protein